MSVWLAGAPRDRLHDLASSYCGIDATQAWVDFYLWDRLLDMHPVEGIVELGTAWGGFSLFLAHQARARGITFKTFDNVDHRTAGPDQTFGAKSARAADLGDAFEQADILAEADRVAAHIVGRRVALLCDNGDKPAEVALYAPMLEAGSVCVVHDWLTEIGPGDIPACLAEVHGELCDELASASRVFVAC